MWKSSTEHLLECSLRSCLASVMDEWSVHHELTFDLTTDKECSMRRLLLKATAVAVLCTGLGSVSTYADDTEGTAPVPTRTDPNNPDTAVYRASDIMNVPVKSDDGAEIGRIKDLVINGESREVLYAVVAMNDGKEKDSLYVIPWTGFQPSFGGGTGLAYTTLMVPQSVWIQAPFFSPVQWRQAVYSQWGPRVNNFYSAHINVNQTNVNRTNVNSNSVTTRKPVIQDEKRPNDPKNPNTNNPNSNPNVKPKPAPAPKATEKPIINEPNKPKPNPAPAPGNTEKPKAKQPEPANDTKLPAPKNPDPAGPKDPAPIQKEPKLPK